jgi:broad specificity polyphosphatase/5'/3'-nucleotidase SurE
MDTVMDGYVSVTPIHLDFTNSGAIEWLKSRWNGAGQSFRQK